MLLEDLLYIASIICMVQFPLTAWKCDQNLARNGNCWHQSPTYHCPSSSPPNPKAYPEISTDMGPSKSGHGFKVFLIIAL